MEFRPHSDKQASAVYSDAPIVVAGTGIQYGKGLPEDELVLTDTGYRRVDSICVGDTLFDRNGEQTLVTGVFPQGVRPCFKIMFADGTDLVTDDQHLNVVKIFQPRVNANSVFIGEHLQDEKIISTLDLWQHWWMFITLGYGSARFPCLNANDKRIERILPVPKRRTICFSVDSPTKTYIVRGQVVTHNTTIGAVKSRIAACTFTDPEDNFIIVAPTYKIMSQSTLPAFLKFMDGCGHLAKVDMTYRVYGGGQFIFRTATDADSIVGITNVRFIWGDEAGLFSLYFWENIQARAAFRNAQICLTTSPYTLNWVYKQLIRPKQRNPQSLPHVFLIQAASWENPYMPAEFIARSRETMDARRFNALFGGQWERMAGLVYDVFDEEENVCDPVPFPPGTRFFGGIDWGYTDPFVLEIVALTPDGMKYLIAEFYRSGLTIAAIADSIMPLIINWGIEHLYCGPDQPASIEELNRRCRKQGVKCGASAADNGVRKGIDKVYEMMKDRSFKVFRGACPHFVNQVDTYHYPEPQDLKPDQDAKDLGPVKQDDHALDAGRYLLVSLPESAKKLKAIVPGERKLDHHDEWERIKRQGNRRAAHQDEVWK